VLSLGEEGGGSGGASSSSSAAQRAVDEDRWVIIIYAIYGYVDVYM
jgi:hypothetical protein